MTGAAFRAYAEPFPAATLKPGDIVVMDNLSAYKVVGVRNVLEKVGAQLGYLPPYSPDLNPIENAFAKLKTLARSAAERIINGLQQQIAKTLDAFSETGYANIQAMRKIERERSQHYSCVLYLLRWLTAATA